MRGIVKQADQPERLAHRQVVAATESEIQDAIATMIDMLDRLGVDYRQYDLRKAAEGVLNRRGLYSGIDPADAEPDEKLGLDDSDYYEEIDLAARSERAPYLFDMNLY